MFKRIFAQLLVLQVAVFAGFMVGGRSAQAANNFSSIARNITDSIADLPGLLSAMSYLMGLLLGVLGVLKIKDHVENPSNTPLKDGAVRLAAGGALFALPIVFEAMQNTIGTTSGAIGPAVLNKVNLDVS